MTGEAYKHHKDALGNFNKEYIKTEIFPRTWGESAAGKARLYDMVSCARKLDYYQEKNDEKHENWLI